MYWNSILCKFNFNYFNENIIKYKLFCIAFKATQKMLTIHKNESKIIPRENKNLYMCFYRNIILLHIQQKKMKNLSF